MFYAHEISFIRYEPIKKTGARKFLTNLDEVEEDLEEHALY